MKLQILGTWLRVKKLKIIAANPIAALLGQFIFQIPHTDKQTVIHPLQYMSISPPSLMICGY